MSSSVQFPSAAFIILSQTSAQISCGEDGSAVSESAGHHAGRANLILEIMSNCGSVCLLLLFSNIKKKSANSRTFHCPRHLHISGTQSFQVRWASSNAHFSPFKVGRLGSVGASMGSSYICQSHKLAHCPSDSKALKVSRGTRQHGSGLFGPSDLDSITWVLEKKVLSPSWLGREMWSIRGLIWECWAS